MQTARHLYRFRGLIATLVARELKARYRGSALGFLWSLVNPLLLAGVYTLVFDIMLPNRGLGTQPYAVFLISGLFPWIWISTSLLEGAISLSNNANLIRKAVFPAEVLPIVSVFANLVHFLLALPIVALALVAARWTGNPAGGVAAVLLPLVILATLPLLSGLALGLSCLAVHFKDVRDLLGNLLTLLFFLAPIIYPLSLLEGKHWSVFWTVRLNPFTPFVRAFQDVLFFGQVPPWSLWAQMGVVGTVAWVVGTWLFNRLSETLVEAV